MTSFMIGFLSVVGTLVVYMLTWQLHKKIVLPITLPIFLGSILIIAVLLIFNVSYDSYMVGGEWINQLLGPAVVALAYPLYQQRHILKELMIPVLFGTLAGAVVGVVTGIVLAMWSHVDDYIVYSLIPKSVTTPVSMAIADSMGGVTSLAAVFVIVAGIGGTIMSPFVFKLFRINHAIGRGVGLGSASHAVGTANAMERSQLEGSVSTVAMVLSAVVVSFISPAMVFMIM
ncbi:LrgB family protein [Oceanobacillus massiliensis]|uniref:LrgB family protein n=1 Tax=Oceanobacillus massiliensis TaxID=1465765 RepID=UPI000289D77D|nr:LrgB family protein [Oceanobacillus massiliensis]